MNISVEVTRVIGEASVRFVGHAETQGGALTLAQFLATSQQVLDVKTEADKPKKDPEAKKLNPAAGTPSDTASTPASPEPQQNASNDGEPANDDRQFTVEEVTALVTKYAAATVPDGRARMVAILQRHGLKVFRGITDQDTINGVGAMIVKTFEGDGSFDPREAA